MAKAYLLTEADFQNLLLVLDRNPKHGYNGGSSTVFSEVELQAQERAHAFFNYQIRGWIDKVQQ